MKKTNCTKGTVKVLTMILVLIFCASVVTIIPVGAAADVFFDENFDSANALDSFTKDLPSPMTATITNNQLDLKTTATSSGIVGSVTKTFIKPLKFEVGKKYVFAFEFSTDRAGEMRNVFTVNGGDFNSNLYFSRLNAVKVNGVDTLAVLYPGGNSAVNSDTASGAYLAKNTMYGFMYIVDGTTKKVESLYINGTEVVIEDLASFPTLPDTITSVSIFQKCWSKTSTKYDNLRIYEADAMTMISPVQAQYVVPGQKNITLRFSNVVSTISADAVTLSKGNGIGAPIPLTVDMVGNTVEITAATTLEENTNYTLKVKNIMDIFGNTVAETEIAVRTYGKSYCVLDTFEQMGDIDKYSTTIPDDATFEIVDRDDGKALNLIVAKKEEYLQSKPEFFITRTNFESSLLFEEGYMYGFELDFKANTKEDIRRFFVYGSGDTDCLFKVKKDGSNPNLYVSTGQLTDVIINTDKSIAPKEWANLKVIVDGGTKAYDVYLDGEKLNSDSLTRALPDSITSIGFAYKMYGYFDADESYDNVQVYKLTKGGNIALNGIRFERDEAEVPSTTQGVVDVVYNIRNEAEYEQNARIVIAVYDGDVLYDVVYKNRTISIGTQDYTEQVNVNKDGLRIKAMLWKDSLSPLGDYDTLGHQ